jgi:hypothetical protein
MRESSTDRRTGHGNADAGNVCDFVVEPDSDVVGDMADGGAPQ